MAASDRLVRLAVLGGALLAVSAFTVAFAFSASPDVDVKDGTYLGATLLPPGPGIGGLPLIPVRIGSDGILEGVPTHLDWYSYCRTEAPGLELGAPFTNEFTYSVGEERLRAARAQGIEVWFEPLLGEKVRAQDFTEDWQGAHVKWRSPAGDSGARDLNAVILRVPSGTYSTDVELEFAPHGFVAFNQDDTHFCCQVGWHLNNSPHTRASDGFELLYDACHDDRYDPRVIERYEWPPGGRHTLERNG